MQCCFVYCFLHLTTCRPSSFRSCTSATPPLRLHRCNCCIVHCYLHLTACRPSSSEIVKRLTLLLAEVALGVTGTGSRSRDRDSGGGGGGAGGGGGPAPAAQSQEAKLDPGADEGRALRHRDGGSGASAAAAGLVSRGCTSRGSTQPSGPAAARTYGRSYSGGWSTDGRWQPPQQQQQQLQLQVAVPEEGGEGEGDSAGGTKSGSDFVPLRIPFVLGAPPR